MTFRYWPIRKRIPGGWRLACYLPGNHGRYSKLLRKVSR